MDREHLYLMPNANIAHNKLFERAGLSIWLVLVWWLLITAQSIVNLGLFATIAFLLLPAIAVWLYPRNALVFLIATFFLPIGSVQLPRAYLFLFVTVFLVRSLCRQPQLRTIHNGFTGLLLGWLFICSVMVFVASNQDVAINLLIVHFQTVLFCLALFLFLTSLEDVIYTTKWLCFLAGIAFFICLIHWFLYEETWMSYKISRSSSGWSSIGKNTLSSIDDTRRFLWPGTDPNFYASMLIFPFFSAFGFALSANKRQGFGWWIVVILCAFGILGTYSRSAFLVTVFCMLPLLLRYKKQTFWGVVLLGIVFALIVSLAPTIQDRILSIGVNLKDSGGTYRAERALVGLALYPQNPFGTGLGAAEDFFRTNSFSFMENSHNTYIQVLLEVGPQGLGIIIAILGSGLIGLNRSSKLAHSSNNSTQGLLFSAMFFGAIASAFFSATIPASDLKSIFLPSALGFSLYRYYYQQNYHLL